MILKYPVPPRKETSGRTDLYIASWLKDQPRDKVIYKQLLTSSICYMGKLKYYKFINLSYNEASVFCWYLCSIIKDSSLYLQYLFHTNCS